MGAERERVLVDRIRAGEERAFQELIEQFAPVVYTLMHRVVGHDRPRAEELAQEVFLRVDRGMPYFQGEAGLSTWIFRIAADTWMEIGGDRASESPGAGPLERAIAKLPPNYRLLIAAHGLTEVHADDLAEALRLAPGTVNTHRHRAKRQLRRLLESSQ